jgi:T5SS/PEP-CTERM-associated repeat protein
MFLAMAAGASLPWANRAAATTYYWGVGDGNWSTATNWLPNGVPGEYPDVVNIVQGDNVARTVTYDWIGQLSSLTVDLTGGLNFNALSIAANDLTCDVELVGYSGNGAINQTGGTNTLYELDLGSELGSTGTYTLGTGAILTATSEEYVGDSGTGTFNQTGGTNTIHQGGLDLGDSPGSVGIYALGTGATLSSPAELIGNYGTGTFSQTGGTNTVSGELFVGQNLQGSGTYTLGTGATLSSSFEYVGGRGSGTFNQSGGTNTLYELDLGSELGSTGTYTLGTGAILTAASEEYVGDSGNGTFNQTGGTNTVSSELDVGLNSQGSGTYTLGTGAALSSPYEYIGNYGTGTFNQTGGTNTVSEDLVLGDNSGATGTYSLGTGATLSAPHEYIGSDGNGTFNQTGGTNTISNDLVLGDNSLGTGTYTLGAGATLSSLDEFIGDGGSGTFNQTGGTNTVTGSLSVGAGSSYSLSGGVLNVQSATVDGPNGFNQSGGSLSCSNNLALGEESGSIGIYNLYSGAVSVSGVMSLGGTSASSGGRGNFYMGNQGGPVTLGGLKIWNTPGSGFTQDGGTVDVGYIDTSGNPSLYDWLGGTLDLTSTTTEVSLDSTGLLGSTISIGSGQNLITNFTVYVGNSSPASMTISGGGTFVSNANDGSVIVTNLPGADGSSVTIDGIGSSWTVNGTGNMRIGAYKTGTLTVQNGGSFSSQIAVGLGYNNISGTGKGNGIVNVQSGGTFTASNGLYIGGSPSGSAGTGTFNLSGGTANVTGTTEIWNGQSSLNVTGGVFSSGTLVDLGAYYQNAGTATFGAIRGTGQMTITGGLTTLATGGGESDIGALSLSGTGTLDITNNHLFINYGNGPDPIAAIAGYIKSGYNGGAWNGPGIISSAALTPTPMSGGSLYPYGIGYADGADGVVAGLSSGQIEVAYALLGDANLDGLVNAADFTILAANFNQPVTGWDQGDFNYDGLVNAADFTDLAANFNQSISGDDVSAGDVAALDAFAAANGLLADVPEPAWAGIMAMAGLGMLRRRRRA